MTDWIDDLFDGRKKLDWKTQSVLIAMLETSTLKQEEGLREDIISAEFTPEELRELFIRLESHQQPLSTNPSQTEISKFIKKII
jgi:hypothetical protein